VVLAAGGCPGGAARLSLLVAIALAAPYPLGQALAPEAGPAAFLTWARPGPVVPGLQEDAVPQGLAWLPEQRLWLVTHYRDDGPSVLSVLDADGHLVTVSSLLEPPGVAHDGHVGGVCVAAGRVWIGSRTVVWSAPLEHVLAGPDELLLTPHTVDSRASFVTCEADRVWVGEFARYPVLGKRYKTEPHHHHPDRDGDRRYAWAYGYRIVGEGLAPAPDKRLSLPDETQGLAFVGDRVVLSRSYGRDTPSRIEVHHDRRGKDLFLDEQTLDFEVAAPPLAEGLAAHPVGVAVLFESAATPYRKGSVLQVDQVLLVDLEGLRSRGPVVRIPGVEGE